MQADEASAVKIITQRGQLIFREIFTKDNIKPK